MTIKELEQALGMTRANIRFYEQEGLLSPARNPNGYRDYSQEDLETLKKIKLLRSLGLDLDTIRALQAGKVTLSQALRDQLTKLEADESSLAGAREICTQLRRGWLTYEDLDAGPWLERLDSPPTSEEPAPGRKARPLPEGPFRHPWRRYFARSLDLSLYSLGILAVLQLGLHVPLEFANANLAGLIISWLAHLPMLLLEPLMLSRWGTTPGKALFGIRVLDNEGQKMSLRQARARTREVFAVGMGYGIPGYGAWREYRALKECESWEWHDWEVRVCAGEPERMTVSDAGWRCWAYVGAEVGAFALAVLVVLQSLMPPCRGELDLAAFCRNVNFYQRYFSLGEMDFTERGIREEEPTGPGVLVVEPEYEETWNALEEGGETVGFRYTLHARGSFFDGGITARQLGLLAYAGALPETNCVSFFRDGWLDLVEESSKKYGWDFDVTHRGLRLTQRARFSGGKPLVDQAWSWVAAHEGEELTLDVEFTVSRADYRPPQPAAGPMQTPESPDMDPVVYANEAPPGEYAPWQTAYADFLAEELRRDVSRVETESGEVSDLYCLYDGDEDGTPELFIQYGMTEAESYTVCFAFRDGKVEALAEGAFGSGQGMLCGCPGLEDVPHYYTRAYRDYGGRNYLLDLPIYDYGALPRRLEEPLEDSEVRTAIGEILWESRAFNSCSGDNLNGGGGYGTLEEYLQWGDPHRRKPLVLREYAFADANGDGQTDGLLCLETESDEYGNVSRSYLVLSLREGEVYGYFFSDIDGFGLDPDGTVYLRQAKNWYQISFYKDQCYDFPAPRDPVEGYDLAWDEYAPNP